MSLNIKNPEAHRLATELARQTGVSLTEAVTEALREKLERVSKPRFNQKKYDALVRIAHDCANRMSIGTKEIDIAELLYDERGLPK
jgi:antitoxin VapB